MEDKLDNLRNAMKQSIYTEKRFGDQQKRKIRQKVKAESNKGHWWPGALSTLFVIFFLGFGAYLVSGAYNTSQDVSKLEPEKPAETENAAGEEIDGSQSQIQVDLPESTPIEVNEELLANLSIPLNLQEVLPYVKAKPMVAATAHLTGYNVSAYYPVDADTEIVLIENVEAPDLIAEALANHVPIWEDEQQVEVNGHPAFYSEDQKEMLIFTKERYFTVYGVEKEKLFEIASLFDLDKPVTSIMVQELKLGDK